MLASTTSIFFAPLSAFQGSALEGLQWQKRCFFTKRDGNPSLLKIAYWIKCAGLFLKSKSPYFQSLSRGVARLVQVKNGRLKTSVCILRKESIWSLPFMQNTYLPM